jgi:hypothetical protein
MAEQTFKSPGFFEREIEIINRPIFKNTATPVGLIGTAERGPAFVPTTVSSIEEYIRIFGAPDRRMLSGHAATEFFRNNGKALTFCRTLGSGSGDDAAKAGFKLSSGNANGVGSVFFIAAQHQLNDAEFLSLGMFNDNDSHTTNMNLNGTTNTIGSTPDQLVHLVRAMLFAHKDVYIKVGSSADAVTINATSGKFDIQVKLSSDDSLVESYSVSLDPSSPDYISKVLNTDPLSFEEHKVLLYTHFPVDVTVAETKGRGVAVLRGNTTGAYDAKYSNFQKRFTSPETPSFISQPFGDKEYDLFHFESLDDGAYANDKYKISISNLRASTDPTNEFGTFTVSIRDLKDTDEAQIIYETYTNCSLDANSTSFIGNVIGDQKVYYNFETNKSERRLIREGSFKNNSTRVRVVVSDDVLNGESPSTSLPFGYRGVPALLLNQNGRDGSNSGTLFTTFTDVDSTSLNKAVMPPLPSRFKLTKGSVKTGTSYAQTFTGESSPSESVDFNLHWGLMTSRIKDINNPNYSTEFNHLLENYTKFLGADSTVISTKTELSDSHNNNKFSLAKVCFKTPTKIEGSSEVADLTVGAIKGTVGDLFKDAVYIRNADVSSTIYDSSTHTIDFNGTDSQDPLSGENQNADIQNVRMTLAKLLAEDPLKFNKYSVCAKFTAPFYGGFDGLNITDSDSFYMTDRAASIETGGKASTSGFASALSGTSDASLQGSELSNNVVSSYLNAVSVMTDEMIVNHNVLLIPNIRDPFITDTVKIKCEQYGKALYLMDIPQHDSLGVRVFVNEKGISSGRPDVDETASAFDGREVNSSYTASYFPDIKILDFSDDEDGALSSRRMIKVPPSIVALGALAKTDDISQPWFAPAGFTRGSLETIQAIDVRLNAENRDTLYEARINPIANFPNKQFVIFGQKTSQLARTALDRVNVRRLVLEVKRRIELIAQGLLFEQNNSETRQRFVQSSSSQLASIQIDQGIEDFRVVMDDTNNTNEDVDNNRLNGRIIIVPTRAVEFIAIDFVITNAGVEFP